MTQDPLVALTNQCLGEIGRLAYLFAGEPDDVVEEALAAMRYSLEETIPTDTVDQLVSAVMRCKAEIERRGINTSISRH